MTPQFRNGLIALVVFGSVAVVGGIAIVAVYFVGRSVDPNGNIKPSAETESDVERKIMAHRWWKMKVSQKHLSELTESIMSTNAGHHFLFGQKGQHEVWRSYDIEDRGTMRLAISKIRPVAYIAIAGEKRWTKAQVHHEILKALDEAEFRNP